MGAGGRVVLGGEHWSPLLCCADPGDVGRCLPSPVRAPALPLVHLSPCLSTPPHPPPHNSCVLMCHAPKKEYYKKFLFEPLPGECDSI